MAKKRLNEARGDLDLYNYIKEHKTYTRSWDVRKTDNAYLQEVLDKASKSGSDHRGEPDLIYINPQKKLLVLLENKHQISQHRSQSGDNPRLYAVDGIRHYLSFFTTDKLKAKDSLLNYFRNWTIVGIAFSGDINIEYDHLITTFIVSDNTIRDIETRELLNEEDYIYFSKNIDIENISKRISRSSGEINRMLRTLDSQKRPVLLSALMICLYDPDPAKTANDFRTNYGSWTARTIINNIPTTIESILGAAGIDSAKIKVLNNELAFIQTDNDLNRTDILKEILKELEDNVIPLFNKKTNYDIIGKFYEEFLRYAGITNVKKGIVLTPSHITTLFTELIEIKTNDVIIDICCGTGTFLISGMNKLVTDIQHSRMAVKTDRIENVKLNQLIGFEKNSTMYTLAISNMLFRGDAKARVFNVDAFSAEADAVLKTLKKEGIVPTIGFINPPYGGKDNATNPTKKEVQFLERMLGIVSGYGIIIAPLSTYFNDDTTRNRILANHTLKYVVNMPPELFQPNAMTNTAIAVFETARPHNDREVIFYDLKDDGLVLSKNRGRTDVLNKWTGIQRDLLQKLRNPERYQDNVTLVKTTVSENDEWIIQAHSKADFTTLAERHFINTIKERIIFSTKFELELLNRDIDEITLLEIIQGRLSNKPAARGPVPDLDVHTQRWADFRIEELFRIQKGERLVELERVDGRVPLITASAFNNGITSFIEYNTFSEVKRLFRNKITVDMFCNVFYHDYEYFSDDNIHTLLFRDESFEPQYDNIYVNLFLVTLLRQLAGKYGFGRQVRLKRFEREIIRLPVKNKKPDWAFMEGYIKALPYSSSIRPR